MALMRVCILVSLAVGSVASAQPGGFRAFLQPENPVYADDSPAAADTLARVPQLVASGNHSEAVRALQALLDTEPHRVAPTPGDASLFVSVRHRVHEVLLGNPELLAMYRATRGPVAETKLAEGDVYGVETSYLLTSAGFEAALRIAQLQLEAGRFDSARLTLEQLEGHPDRRGVAAATAATLLAQVARYLDRDRVWAMARQWADDANAAQDPPRTPAPWPALAKATSFDPIGRGGKTMALSNEEIPSRPLWSMSYVQHRTAFAESARPSRGPWLGLWIFPTATSDTIYLNDGLNIRAWDRYTLELKWDIVPQLGEGVDERAVAEARQRLQPATVRTVDDVATITVSGRRAYATTGIPVDGQRDGDPRLHAIDAQTGRILWSANLPMLDPRLTLTSIRGNALSDVDSVIVPLRRSVQTQRVVSVYLASLDAATGELQWVRPIGSAGALTFQRARGVAEGAILDQGVVYVSDAIGVYSAVESATGRPIWVRLIPQIAEFGQLDRGSPWEANRPLVVGDRVFVLPSGRGELLVLDRATGATVARRSVSPASESRYLVHVGDHLGIIGSTSARFLPLSNIEGGPLRSSDRFTDSTRGRAIVVGSQVLVPVLGGAVVLNPVEPFTPVRTLELHKPGMTIALGDQIVVADDDSLHSYLSWEAADRLLSRRMAEHPDDPRSAVSMAELAYRGGQAGRIGPAADQALAAISRDPLSERNRASRQRLFDALLEMVTVAQAGRAADPTLQGASVLTLEHLDAIVSRLGRAAGTNEQQVSHLMSLGWLRRAQGRPRDAIEAYQQILTSQSLSQTRWASDSGTSRADAAATRQIKTLVDEFGPTVYAAFDAEARRELAALAPTASASEVEALARRYPVSSMASVLWIRAADAHLRGGRTSRAHGALFRALAAAESHRADANATKLGEAAGQLLTSLRDAGRTLTAAFVLERITRDHPDLVLSVRDVPIDTASLRESLRAAHVQRLPRIGQEIDGDPQVIEGWAIMPSLSRSQRPTTTESVMLISTVSAEVALWGVNGALPAGVLPTANAGALTRLWARSYEGRPPLLLRHEPGAVYLAWFTPQGTSVECIDTVSGASRWRTAPFSTLFPRDPALEQRLVDAAGRPVEFQSPLLGSVRVTDLVAAVGDGVIVLSERTGRTAVFDKETGRLVSAFTSVVGAVYDVAAGHGWVVIAGSADPPQAGNRPLESPPMVAVHDAATGAQVLAMSDLGDPIRWVRVIDASRLLIATDTRIVVSHPRTGDMAWEAVGGATLSTRDGWADGNRLFLLTADSMLHFASLDEGGLRDAPLETRERTDARMLTRASVIGNNVAFATSRGLVITGPGGEVLGIDAINAAQGMVPPEPSESLFVAAELAPRMYGQTVPVFPMHLLTSRSASLVRTHYLALRESPTAVAVLDAAVAITSANVTVVYSMPP